MNKDTCEVVVRMMGSRYRCKNCKMGSRYHYLLAAGKKIKCPHCGAISVLTCRFVRF